MPSGWIATDVTIVGGGSTPPDVVVVGTDDINQVFVWRLSTQQTTGLAEYTDGRVTVSADGTKIAATTYGGDGIARAARHNGTSWVQGPGLGGVSGTEESSAYALSGDGNVVAGLGWINSGSAHAYTWTQPNTAADLGGLYSDPASRLNEINHDGSVCVGWKALLNGQRQGAYWVNGVLQPQFTLGGLTCGEAYAVNSNGTHIAGMRIYGASGANATAGWRWDAGVMSALPNLPGETAVAIPAAISDDGTIVAGNSALRAILWQNNVPVALRDHLVALGTQGLGTYTDIGYVTGMSADGGAICGNGRGSAFGQPNGGWVVISPSAIPTGTPFCFGDGTGTACPCGNAGAPGNGCASSLNPDGARLIGTGSASLIADTLQLTGYGMPNSSALYFQGTTRQNGGAGSVLSDGLRCAGGPAIRLGIQANSTGTSTYPSAGDAPISVRGAVPSVGSVRTYQVWYRNAATFCTIAPSNLTNGLEITWGF
jgi:uncharacterized membrane protein